MTGGAATGMSLLVRMALSSKSRHGWRMWVLNEAATYSIVKGQFLANMDAAARSHLYSTSMLVGAAGRRG